MKMIQNPNRCAAIEHSCCRISARASLPTFLGGCAEGPYVTAYDRGYYYPTSHYAPDYDYYGYPYSYYEYGPRYSRTVVQSYSRTVVRSGVRYYDGYGPRYY